MKEKTARKEGRVAVGVVSRTETGMCRNWPRGGPRNGRAAGLDEMMNEASGYAGEDTGGEGARGKGLYNARKVKLNGLRVC